MIDKTLKPHRPLGLTIAILVAIIFYSIIPLLFTAQLLLVEAHMASMETEWYVDEDDTVEQIASGGDLTGGITRFDMIVQGVLAVIFLGVAFFAWRGKPRIMRHVYVLAVIITSLVTLFVTIFPSATGGLSGGSLDSFSRLLNPTVLVFNILLPLYVIWYLNRAPARAFYRGYYLPEELEAIQQMLDS